MKNPIYHNTYHVFSLRDRLRILFGREVKVSSVIESANEAQLTGKSEAKTSVKNIFKRKEKSPLLKSTNLN